MRHSEAFHGFWVVLKCLWRFWWVVWRSDVLSRVRDNIVGSEWFKNVPESFWGILTPICFSSSYRFLMVLRRSLMFKRCSGVFRGVLRCSVECLAVLQNSWRFWSILWCFVLFWGCALIRSEQLWKVPEGSEAQFRIRHNVKERHET